MALSMHSWAARERAQDVHGRVSTAHVHTNLGSSYLHCWLAWHIEGGHYDAMHNTLHPKRQWSY